jgi:hypothetical protein
MSQKKELILFLRIIMLTGLFWSFKLENWYERLENYAALSGRKSF